MSKPTLTKAKLRDSERIVGGPSEINPIWQKKVQKMVNRVDAKRKKHGAKRK